jgi:hypothetical protein
MPYIVDSTKFQAEGAYLHWATVARRLGLLPQFTAVAPQLPEMLHLRWTLNPELGFPTEPFIVWRRHKRERRPQQIRPEISSLAIFDNAYLVDLKGYYSWVQLNVSGAQGVAMAFVGTPQASNVVTVANVTAGNNVIVQLSAPSMEGLLISAGLTINSIMGMKTDDLSQASGWEKYERVGIPVKQSEWAGIGAHGTDQGIFNAFTSAQAAAIDRLKRGAPPIGWAPTLDGTIPAPPWVLPAFDPLLTELNQTVLEDLRQIAVQPPLAQASATLTKPIPPPETSLGQSMSEPGSTSQILPLNMLYMAAGSDCFACLALGFGTAYPVVFSSPTAVNFTMLDYDFMVTARYEKGLLGNGAPVEYAAIVPAPAQANAPPVPANLAEEMMGHLRPLARDANWRGSVRVSWDKPVPIPLFRARSFAFARAGIAPAVPAELIMNQRNAGGPLPIAVNNFTSPEDTEPNRLSAPDREIPIPSNPGKRSMKYAVAHQDIYGQWSTWNTINSTIEQPPADKVRIVSAEFQYTSIPIPPNAKCLANLVIEFLWDWRLRSPLTISFRGKLHAAGYHGEPPLNTTLPTGLQTALGGPFAQSFTLNFNVLAPNGAPTSTWTGYDPMLHCKALNPEGDQQVSFGNAQGNEVRRYRVTIPGFELNFASTGHIGLALWAQGQEAIPPNRAGVWSDPPSQISTSDPRPPVIAPDIVTLSSLPDAAGESHAMLKWSASPGAEGYFIYETTETKLLNAVGAPEPDPDHTLSARLTRLREIFDQNPAARRSEFVRRNSRPIKAISADVTIPRGSTAIHLYVVLGLSAGQIEAPWIASSKALYAFAVPRVPKPAIPMIEVVSFLDKVANQYRAKVRVTTRKGPLVNRIDLHRVRVDDAVKDLDTMGPPVLTIDAQDPGWKPQTKPEPHVVAAVEETPSGSWKRVWYRAAAWSQADPLRGTLAARSPASNAAWVVIPPATGPNITPLVLEWAGGGLGDVLVRWTSTAPLKKTPLGPHKLSINAKRVGAPPDETPLIAFEADLSELGTTQPVTGSRAWRIEGTKPVQYRAILRRAAVNDAVQLAVRITDPLGRSSEALATIASGPVLPDPVLSNFVSKTSVTPPGQQLEWVSPTPAEKGVYTLEVRVNRPPRQLSPNGPLVPQSPIAVEMALDDIPLDEAGPVPGGVDPLRVRRIPGVGPLFSYYAFVRVPFTQIIVRLTAPDGRVAQHIQLPS